MEILRLANQDRRVGDILDALVVRFELGAIALESGRVQITAADVARTVLGGRLEKALASLARSAVFVA